MVAMVLLTPPHIHVHHEQSRLRPTPIGTQACWRIIYYVVLLLSLAAAPTSCFVVPIRPAVSFPVPGTRGTFPMPSLSATTRGSDVAISAIADLSVLNRDGSSVALGSLLGNTSDKDTTTILACLSHFGDFNAWEVTQQYISAVKASDSSVGLGRCKIVLVGIGSADSSAKFADDLDIGKYKDMVTLVADPTGVVTDTLNCYRGWLAVDKAHAARWPATDVNPYVKLFGMIFGLGSPGTIEKVVYGYVGNEEGGASSRQWVIEALLQGTEKGRYPKITAEAFDGVPADSGLRPFELATLRAQTGVHIVLNWGKLGPKDGDLFTRMGGTFVFRGGECIYAYFDEGILTYAPIDEVVSAAEM